MSQSVIRAGQVVTPFEMIQDGAVVTESSGRIAWVGAAKELPAEAAGAPSFDYPDGRLLPGLVDIHVHGGFGHSFGEGDLSAGLHLYSREIPRSGVTGFLLSIAAPSAAELTELIKAYVGLFENERFEGAQPLGLHLEGPFMNPEKKGAFEASWLRQPNLAEARSYLEAGRGWIKQMTMAPELPGAQEVAAYFKSQGVVVALGHTNTDYAMASAALHGDFEHVTHTFNAQRGFSQREPGVFGAVLDSDRASLELIADTIHVHPGAIKLLARAISAERIILITDALAATGLPDGDYESLGQKVRVRQGLVLLADGTIAGSTVFLSRALRNASEIMEYSYPQVVRMATLNPARLLHEEARRGSLQAGNRGDLTVVDPQGEVLATWVSGEQTYHRA